MLLLLTAASLVLAPGTTRADVAAHFHMAGTLQGVGTLDPACNGFALLNERTVRRQPARPRALDGERVRRCPIEPRRLRDLGMVLPERGALHGNVPRQCRAPGCNGPRLWVGDVLDSRRQRNLRGDQRLGHIHSCCAACCEHGAPRAGRYARTERGAGGLSAGAGETRRLIGAAVYQRFQSLELV